MQRYDVQLFVCPIFPASRCCGFAAEGPASRRSIAALALSGSRAAAATADSVTLSADAGSRTASYDTIRDAILTCARKPTRIGLIYRTETTTKNCKTEKLKSKCRYVRSNSKSLGNHVDHSEKRKRKAAVGRICRKRF